MLSYHGENDHKGRNNIDQLKYPLAFFHKFNQYKLSGLVIEEQDLQSLARVYGVPVGALEELERESRRNIERLAAALPPSNKPPMQPPLSILAIGDSISSDRESYLKILNCYWEADPSRHMLDAAVSGDTTSDLITRFYASIMNQEFQWAVLFIGTNDSLQLDDRSRIPVCSLEEYKRNIRFITETLIAAGKRLIQVTVPPVDNVRLRNFFPEVNSIYSEQYIEEVNSFIREWAGENGYAVADLARALRKQSKEVLEPDGLHLNGRGQGVLCELLLELLP